VKLRAPLPVVSASTEAAARPRSAPAIALDAEADRARAGALTRYWYVACLSSELEPGRPIGRTLFGTPIVLFRDERGAPAALFDRCLHRNAALSAGVVVGGRLACAYHGWTYDAAGRCVEIPSLGPAQQGAAADRADARDTIVSCPADAGAVERWPALEQDGLVFVHPGGDATSARRPAFRTPHWGEPGWSVYYMVTHFSNGVTNLVENFMDVPHTAFVHQGWFRNRGDRRIATTVRSIDESVLVTYEEGDRLTGVGRLFNPGGAPSEHTDKFYAPHVTRVDYRFGDTISYVITSQVTPVGPMESMVYTAISYRFPFGAAGALAARAARPLMRWYTTRVIEQDVAIMDVQRRGLSHAPGGGTFIGTDADEIHVAIERWRRWLLEGAHDADRPATSERHIEMFV
jgi:phenylpropionate dioxygenase-like ring-hydroxylating dioxygenase large terminal subunit